MFKLNINFLLKSANLVIFCLVIWMFYDWSSFLRYFSSNHFFINNYKIKTNKLSIINKK